MGTNTIYHVRQPIKQSNFYSANIPGLARLSGATDGSVFNSQIDEAVPKHQWAIGCACVYGAKAKCLETFLEGCNWSGWMERQRAAVPKTRGATVKCTCTCTCIGLDPRDQHTKSFVWSQWTGWEWWGRHGVKLNRLFFKRVLYADKLILKSTLYFTGTQWWEHSRVTLSKWRWLCHNTNQLILNMLQFGEVGVRNTWQNWIAVIEMSRHKSSCK